MKKKFYLSILLITILVIGISTSAYATLKSVPGTSIYSSDHNGYFVGIRKMEAAGGILGLNAEINDLGQETSSSNNIDSHLLKESELEAINLLVDSQYGVGYSGITKDADVQVLNEIAYTTTKNASGIYDIGVYGYSYGSFSGYYSYDGPALASMVGNKDSYTGAFKEVKSRYLNIYEGTPYNAEVAMKIFAGKNIVYTSAWNVKPSARSAYAVIVNGSGI